MNKDIDKSYLIQDIDKSYLIHKETNPKLTFLHSSQIHILHLSPIALFASLFWQIPS